MFDIGQKIGLWEVIGHPSLSVKSKVTSQSLVPVRCECGKTSSVQVQYLKTGRSLGCRPCRLKGNKGNKKGFKNLPVKLIPSDRSKCPDCGTAAIKKSIVGDKRRMYCKECKKFFRVSLSLEP